jgi:hypothetical protein
MAKKTGTNRFEAPQKSNHMRNFEVALQRALDQFDGEEQDAPVVFQVDVSPNPGGVKEYRVIVGK